MYGENIEVLLGDEIKCTVWVLCTPNMSSLEKQHKALDKLKKTIAEKESLIDKAKEAGIDLTR